MHTAVEPKILYFGTPVVLISTVNEDGSFNLAPISSAWWLNQSCVLGMSSKSQTVQNLVREGQLVVNMPTSDMVDVIERLTLLTGKNPVPESKAKLGYRYEADKFGIAGVTPLPSSFVRAPRVLECPVHMEASVVNVQQLEEASSCVAVEIRILKVHVEEHLLMDGKPNYINPAKWNPMIMNFCEYFGLSEQLSKSRLAPVFGCTVEKK